MKKLSLIICCLWFGSHACLLSAQGQHAPLRGQKVGVFISAKATRYDTPFFIEVAQFLQQEEDRSNVGKMKSEFIIRMGWLLTEQLQALSGADTVYFLNGDLKKGRAFLAAYDSATQTLIRPGEALQALDWVLVLQPFHIDSRKHRSVYVASNKLVTRYTPVKQADLSMVALRMDQPRNPKPTRVCYDDLNHERQELYFDFLKGESKMGMFLSEVFSQWWAQWQLGENGHCRGK